MTSRWQLNYDNIPPPGTAIRDPPGFVQTLAKASSKNATSLIPSAPDLSALRAQKAWDLALAPAKNVPMQAFMMYMTGGGIQIFSVMSVAFLLKGAIQGMLSVQQAFAPFRTTPKPGQAAPSLAPQQAVYLLCQVGLLCVGLWKCNNMGLLPTHESDWLAFRDKPAFAPRAEVAHVRGGWDGQETRHVWL